MQQANASFSYPVAMLPYFSQCFDISVCDFTRQRKIKVIRKKREKRKGERETGENICIKGQSRRVADVNLLHPDEAKSRKGSTGRDKGDRGQYREIGRRHGWGVAVRRLLYFLIIYHPS